MIPSARAQAVLDILERIQSSRVPMDLTIGDYMRHRRYIGSKDRADIVERVYAIFRHWARLGWTLTKCGMDISSRNLLMAYLVLVEKNADISKLFDGTKYAPEPLSQDEEKFMEDVSKIDFSSAGMPEAVRVECPPLYEESLRAYFGEEFATEMEAFMKGASLDLRVNLLLSDRDTVQSILREDRVKTEASPYSPWGLRVAGKTYLSETKAFRKGWIDIQDEGSQMIALACNAQPGQQILDYCAGAGGKTLAIANAMLKKGRIVAMDMDAGRLEKARDRFRRAHVSDIIEPRPLSDERHRKWLRRQKGTFDVVLTDVPCSGTGTWRRNPDLRWRIYGPTLEEIIPVQAEILDKVAPCVKTGGRLVYATCSLLPEENERQIESFLTRHPEFRLAPLAEIWPNGCPIPCKGSYLRLTPARHQTDGFFAAVLVRIPTESDQEL
jgi:16S rRNA (cytosine967-C5)-methyltransferase